MKETKISHHTVNILNASATLFESVADTVITSVFLQLLYYIDARNQQKSKLLNPRKTKVMMSKEEQMLCEAFVFSMGLL